MITNFQRNMLADAGNEFQKAGFSLFKAVVFLEKVEHPAFEKTIEEIKKTITDINDSYGSILDFINEQDFSKTEKE